MRDEEAVLRSAGRKAVVDIDLTAEDAVGEILSADIQVVREGGGHCSELLWRGCSVMDIGKVGDGGLDEEEIPSEGRSKWRPGCLPHLGLGSDVDRLRASYALLCATSQLRPYHSSSFRLAVHG